MENTTATFPLQKFSCLLLLKLIDTLPNTSFMYYQSMDAFLIKLDDNYIISINQHNVVFCRTSDKWEPVPDTLFYIAIDDNAKEVYDAYKFKMRGL